MQLCSCRACDNRMLLLLLMMIRQCSSLLAVCRQCASSVDADELVAAGGVSPLEVPAMEEAVLEWLRLVPPLVGAAARHARWGVVEALLEGGAVAVLGSYMGYSLFGAAQRTKAVEAVHTLLVASQRLWEPPRSLSMLLPATPGAHLVLVRRSCAQRSHRSMSRPRCECAWSRTPCRWLMARPPSRGCLAALAGGRAPLRLRVRER